jgi:hypothetical protein
VRKLLLASFAALLAAGGAQAVVNGEPDGNRHPYVAAIGFIDAATGRPGAFCSGTVVSPTVVVTAGHCTYHSAAAFVWLDPQWNPSKPPAGIGRPVTHPDFNPDRTLPNTGDLGVVLLGSPVQLPAYGALPRAGYLEELGQARGHELGVSIVGYGFQSLDPPVRTGERTLGTARIKNLSSSIVRDYGLKISGANGSGGSGSCSGDSGGPILHVDSNVVVAVQSFGDVDTCRGATYGYRTDTPSARAFLDDYVAVP